MSNFTGTLSKLTSVFVFLACGVFTARVMLDVSKQRGGPIFKKVTMLPQSFRQELPVKHKQTLKNKATAAL